MSEAGTMRLTHSMAYFEWEIPSACIISKNVGEYLRSPHFTTSFSKDDYWRLLFYPGGKDDADWLSLYLSYCGKEKVTVNPKLFILNDERRIINEVNDLGEKVFPSNGLSNWGIPKIMQKKKIVDPQNRSLVGDKLKVLCEIIYKPSCVVPRLISSINSISATDDTHRFQASKDFERLFESKHHSDVTIIIGENKIQAHKAIVTSRSPVFDAMFKHDMKEKEQNTIEITDVSYEVMTEVLRFMYATKVNDIQKIATELLVAAEKYSVGGLKTLCEDTLFKNLKTENAIEFLKLADMCNAENLKTQVIEFIVSNQQAIIEKPEFEFFGDLHSKLQCELFRAVVAKNSSQ